MITMLWSRVEAQALRYMPWVALELGQHAGDEIYNLDYSQILLPSVLLQSLRRRHFLVLLASLIPIILRVQIILSPSIFESSTIQISSATQLQTRDSFVDTYESTGSTRPYYHASALRNSTMDPPFGLFEHGAYQTFGSSPGHASATQGASLEAHVDGFFIDMQCIELANFTSSAKTQPSPPTDRLFEITFDLYFEDCADPITVSTTWLYTKPSSSFTTIQAIRTFYDPRLENRQHCSSLPQQQPEFLYFVAYYPQHNDKSEEYLPRLFEGGAVICSPTAWSSKVEVVDDGFTRNVTVAPSPSDEPIDFETNLWGSIADSIPVTSGGWNNSLPSHFMIDFGPLSAALRLSSFQPNFDNMSLYRSDMLRQAVMNLTRELGPIVAHYGLRQAGENRVDGLAIYDTDRILVNQAVCVSMTVLSGICTCLAIGVLFQTRRPSKVWYREPATILGLMSFFLKGHQLNTPGLSDKSGWTTCSYTPLVLRSWYRGLAICYGLGVIISLLLSLRKSQTAGGLATVQDENYSFLLWKSIPTLAVLIIALYANSSDSAIRALVLFQRLSHGASNAQELDKSPMDMLGLNATYYSFRFGVPKVAISQVLVVLCAFLATLSSVLFSSEVVPQSTSGTYQPQSWFGTRRIPESDWDEYNTEREKLKTLYLIQNASSISYPRNTYADLVFPVIPMDELPLVPKSTAKFTIPAAKLASDCFPLSEGADFNATLKPNLSNSTQINPAMLEIYLNDTWDPRAMKFQLGRDTVEPTVYLADSRPDRATDEAQLQTWRAETYVWGRLSPARIEIEEVFVWWCNYSWVEVPTAVTMVEADGVFQIDQTRAPVPDYSKKARPWTPAFDVPRLRVDGKLQDALPLSSSDSMYEFGIQFEVLINFFQTITSEDLGDPERDGNVAKALSDHMSLVAAQLANIEHRLALNETSVSEPYHPGELKPIEITLVDNNRRRVVQNANVTYALASIIYIVVLVNTWAVISAYISYLLPESRQHGLLLDLELKGLVPEGFNALATMASLLHGSNYAGYVPHDAFALPPGQLQEHIAGKHFRIGWFFNRRTEEKVFTIGILGDDDFKTLEDEDTPRTSVTLACESHA